jgi:hypothetical protein
VVRHWWCRNRFLEWILISLVRDLQECEIALVLLSQGDFYLIDGNSIYPVVILQRSEFSHNPIFGGLVLAVTPKHIQHVHPMTLNHGRPYPVHLLLLISPPGTSRNQTRSLPFSLRTQIYSAIIFGDVIERCDRFCRVY